MDNGPDWKKTPPRYRKLIMLTGVISIISIFFITIFKNFQMSQWFAYCFMLWISGILTTFGIYTWSRGKTDELESSIELNLPKMTSTKRTGFAAEFLAKGLEEPKSEEDDPVEKV